MQRLTRRRGDARVFDRGGRARPFRFLRSKYARSLIALGVLGILASLIGGSIFLLSGSGHSGGSIARENAPTVPRRIAPTGNVNTGAVEGKPQFDAPSAMVIDLSHKYEAVFELEDGTVRIELWDDQAPIHVDNFVFLAREQFFDNLTFHRVIAGFVAQGGDPTATSSGGAGYVLPDEEIGGDPAELTIGETGVISMARSGAGTSSSQFFITLNPQPQLDALGFTAFGQVVEGMDLIQALPTRDPSTVPPPPAGAKILSVRIVERDANGSVISGSSSSAS